MAHNLEIILIVSTEVQKSTFLCLQNFAEIRKNPLGTHEVHYIKLLKNWMGNT